MALNSHDEPLDEVIADERAPQDEIERFRGAGTRLKIASWSK